MQQFCQYGSVRGATGNRRPYRDNSYTLKNFQIYIDSQRKFATNAATAGATVLMSNHSEFDIADSKNKMLASRGNGPHPYEQGADAVQRYFRVMQGCARAAQLKLEQRQAMGEK